MRRTPPRLQPLPSRTLRGGEAMRLVSLVSLLVLIIFLMIRMRDPAMWQWLVPNEDGSAEAVEEATHGPAGEKAAPPQGPGEKAAEMGPALESGPTDTDPEERESLAEELQAIEDNSLHIREVEMPAYDRLVRWSARQTTAEIFQRAYRERPTLVFNDFVQHRKDLRGKLVYLDLNVRRVQKADLKTRDGYDLYEMWGFSTESGPWLYCVMAVDLPKDIQVGARVDEHVRVAGYFLKLQGYYPAIGKPNDPYFAPLIIGRALRVTPPKPLAKEDISVPVALGVLGLVVALLAAQFAWMALKKRRKGTIRKLEAAPLQPSEMVIEEWFDRMEGGEPAGNNPGSSPESSYGPAGRNGDGNGEAKLFPDGLDHGPSKSE